jgi:hypothetical protein
MAAMTGIEETHIALPTGACLLALLLLISP